MAALLAGQQTHCGDSGIERPTQSQNITALRTIEAHDGTELQFVQPKGSGKLAHARKQGGHILHGPCHRRILPHTHRHQPAHDGGPHQEAHCAGAQLLAQNGHAFTFPS